MKIKTALDIDRKQIVYDGCMVTVSGEIINLYAPRSNNYFLEDIAHHLGYLCRWNGATKTYYSVAEHCCMMHDQVPDELKGMALFHDCEEAYWGDIIKPVKNLLPTNMKLLMREMRYVIMHKFGITSELLPKAIDEADFRLLQWDFDNLILEKNQFGYNPDQARHQWLKRATAILNQQP
jgi:hypothetical protein